MGKAARRLPLEVPVRAVRPSGGRQEPAAERPAASPGGTRPHRPVDPLGGLRHPGDPPCDVFLTGTVFLDIVFTGLDAAPVRGTENWARGMGSSPGGIANMATALARLGLRTSLAAAFGDDKYGEYCWETLERGEGIDLSHSRTIPGWHSPVTVSLAYEGERTMITHGHAAPTPDPGSPAPGTTPRSRSCVVSLTPDRDQEWIVPAARAGSRLFATVGWDDTGRWDLAALPGLAHCEAFLPNAAEAMRYTGADTPLAAARRLAERVPVAVVTMGEDGACAADGRSGETASVPAIPVDALDTTGAGDVFIAGFVTATLAGWPLPDRLAFAGLTAALSVQEFGGSLSAPGWAQIAAWWARARGAAQGARSRSVPPALARYAFLDRLLPGCAEPAGAGRWTASCAPLPRAIPTLGFPLLDNGPRPAGPDGGGRRDSRASRGSRGSRRARGDDLG